MATRNPRAAAREKVKPISEDLFQVTITLTKAELVDLERVQSLEAQKQKTANRSAAVAASQRCHIQKNDPVKKAERADKRKNTEKFCDAGSPGTGNPVCVVLP